MKKLKRRLQNVLRKKNFRKLKSNKLSEAEINDLKSTIVEIELIHK